MSVIQQVLLMGAGFRKQLVGVVGSGYASEVSLPTLDLSLTGPTLDTRIIFNRAIGPATYYDSSGALQTARTNFLRNSTMAGTVAGSPGTLPTNWNASVSPFNGISQTIVGIGTEAGIAYIDLQLSGTASLATSFIVNLETANQIPAALPQIWTASSYVKLVGGTLTGVVLNYGPVTTNGSIGIEANDALFVPTSAALDTQRAVATLTLANAASTNIRSRFIFVITNGATINLTLRIGGPQLEFAATASSYIPTTTTASGAPRFDYDPVTHKTRGLLIEEARTNTALNSGDFTQAIWIKGSMTLSAGVAGPNGATTGSGFIIASGGPGYAAQALVSVAGTTYTISCFAKAANQIQTMLLMPGPYWADAANRSATFNLSTGVVSATSGGGASATMTPVGNGWYRISLTMTPDLSVSASPQFARSTNVGDNVTTQYYAFGAQIEVGAFPTSYIPTTTTATRPIDSVLMPIGSWFNAAQISAVVDALLVISSNSVFAGHISFNDGTTANRLQLTSLNFTPKSTVSSGGVNGVAIPETTTVTSGVPYKFGCSLIAGTYRSSLNGATPYQNTTGIVMPVGVTTFSLGNVPPAYDAPLNGWISRVRSSRRAFSVIELQLATAIVGSITGVVGSGIASDISFPSLDLDFSTGVLDSRITFSRAVGPATYFDIAGMLQNAASGAPRFDYNPATLVPRGLLIEEARTNSIPNSTMVGAAAGTPGTMPTGWLIVPATGVTSSVIGSGIATVGIPYVDVRFNGTPTASNNTIMFSGASTIAAVTGQTWTGSFYTRLSNGSLANISVINMSMAENTSGGAFITGQNYPIPTPTSDNLAAQRSANTYTLSGGGTVAALRMSLVFTSTLGQPLDVTLRIGAPQLELGAFPTSFIPTAGATAGRPSDIASMPLGSWFNATASTLAADYIVDQAVNPSVNNRDVAVINDGSANNRMVLRGQMSTSGNTQLVTSISGSSAFGNTMGTVAASTKMKAVGAWNGTTMVGSLNGGATVPNAAGMPIGLTTFTIGNGYPGATFYANGGISRIRYWPRALSRLELQAVTMPSVQLTGVVGSGVASDISFLDLNFSTGALDPRIVFSRAAGPATYFDVNGGLQTAVTNTLLWSTDFSNAAWLIFNGSTKGASVVGPDGNNTGMRLNFAAQAFSQFFQNQTVTAGQTFSIYVKAGTVSRCILRFSTEGGPTVALTAEWQRFSFTSSAASTNVSICNVGTDSGTIDIAMPQFESGTVATAYIPTTTAASGAPRFDYDPITHVARGLLIEEARTNSIRNSTMVGAVAGTPGTPPPNWAIVASLGLAIDIVGTGTDTGIPCIDLRFYGTTSSSGGIRLTFENTTQIPAVVGQTWTHSVYQRLIAGTAPLTLAVEIREYAAGVAGTINANASVLPTTAALNTQRIISTKTLVDAGTTTVQPTIRVGVGGSTVYDFTLRIGMPQLELGAFVTSVIPTTGASATRATDIVTMLTGTWFNGTQGTFAADVLTQAVPPIGGAQTGFLRCDDGTNNNEAALYQNNANQGIALGIIGGVTQISHINGPALDAAVRKAAMTYGAVWRCCTNGGAVVTGPGSAGPLPATIMRLGAVNLVNTNKLNGCLQRVRCWRHALSPADLQAVTMPPLQLTGVVGSGVAANISFPSLDLSLTGPTLDSRITFIRTSGPATYFDNTGTMQNASYNYVRNNTMVGAVAGTPGTLPTNWTIGAIVGLTSTVVGMGVEDGISYIDIRLNGTSTGTSINYNFDTTTATAAALNQVWTESWYYRLVGGSLTNVVSFQTQCFTYTAGSSFLFSYATIKSAPTNAILSSQRVATTLTITDATAAFIRPLIQINVSNGAAIDFTIRIGLPQLEQAATVSAPIATSGVGTGAPRFDFDSVTHATRGLLIEEARTNSIRNSTFVGGVAGSPGTLPTNVSIVAVGLTQTLTFSTINGMSVMDVRLLGTTGDTFAAIRFDTNSAIAASNGQTWTESAYVALIAGSLTSINTFFVLGQYAAGSTFLSNLNGSFITGFTGSLQRFSTTQTTNNASITAIFPSLTLSWSIGAAVDVTLRIAAPQLELGAFATSYIPTSSVSATRATDVATMPWISDAAFSLAAEGTFNAPLTSGNQTIAALDDGSSNNRLGLFRAATTGNASALFVAATVSIAALARTPAVAPGDTAKLAASYQNGFNAFASSVNALATSNTTAGVIAPLTILRIGSRNAVADQINGYLRRIRYWTRALSTVELQAVTIPSVQLIGVVGSGIASNIGTSLPSLDLSLTGPTLDPRITFSRAVGPATYYDVAGTLQTAASGTPRFEFDPVSHGARGLLIEEARTNVVFPSVSGSPSWPGTGTGTRTDNSGIAPDGTNTATQFSADATNGVHGLGLQATPIGNTVYTQSLFAKAGTSSKVSLEFRVGVNWVGGVNYVVADLATGTIFSLIGTGPITGTITPVGNGWYRITATSTSIASPTLSSFWANVCNAAGSNTFAGAGESASFWGWQVEAGAFPTSYIPTTSAAATRPVDAAAMAIGPWFNAQQGTLAVDGDLSQINLAGAAFDICGFDDGSGNNIYLIRNQSATTTLNAIAVVAAIVQPQAFTANSLTTGMPFKGAMTYNAAGVVTATLNGGAPGSSTVGALPAPATRLVFSAIRAGQQNGHKSRVRYWPRALSTVELQAATMSSAQLTGVVGSGVASDISFPSLDLSLTGPTLDPRIVFSRAAGPATYYDVAGTLQTAASGTPRFDFDPVSHVARGVLIEEARTNSIRNSTMAGAVTGTPGTIPTNWSKSNTSTLDWNVIGIGTESGITYVDVQIVGTTSTGTANNLFFDGSVSNTAALNAQLWTTSAHMRLVGGSLTNVANITLRCQMYDATSTSLAVLTGASQTVTSAALSSQRLKETFTLNQATTAWIRSFVTVTFAAAPVAVDLTLRIGLPQLELGAFVTSVIPTTSASATRPAEFVSMPIGPWFNSQVGSLLNEFMYSGKGPTGFPRVVQIDDGSNNTVITHLQQSATGQIYSVGTAASVNQWNVGNAGTHALGVIFKQASAWQAGLQRYNLNGVQPQTASGAVIPQGLTTLRIGSDAGGGGASGHATWIKRVAYWSRVLSAAELQAMTT